MMKPIENKETLDLASLIAALALFSWRA